MKKASYVFKDYVHSAIAILLKPEMTYSAFQITVEKPKPKQLFRPMTTGTNSTMNQSQFLAIIRNSLKAREKLRVRGAIGFGCTSHWLKTGASLFSQSLRVAIAIDSHLKITLKQRKPL